MSDKENFPPISPAQADNIADFLNEAGMLRNVPRSGYAFLGGGGESVAEHSFRAALIGHALGRMAGANAEKVVLMCLYHDLHEARTGDFNYVNHLYNTCRSREALSDAIADTGLEKETLSRWDEMEKGESLEARLAKDADQLDLICNLAQELSRGNQQAREWIDSALPRLRTSEGRHLATAILRAAPDRWWRKGVTPQWWINHGE